jgi:hypothetical protein
MRATESLAGSGSLTSFNETLAVLQARPVVADGKFALVISDAEEAGVYERIAGNWQKVAGLPAIFTESLAAVRAEAARDLAQAYAAAANASRQEAAEIVGFDPTLYLLKAGGHITGNLSVGGMASANKILVGAGSGSVGLTINDGHGNSNLTFNHQGGVPDNDSPTQSAARISADTDSDTANLKFMLANATTKGQNVGPTSVLNLSLSSIRLFRDTVVEGSLSADSAAGYWVATNSEAGGGTNNDKIMTPRRTAFSIAANQAVQAWVNFDGANGAIRAAHNVSSVVRNGQGNFAVNLATSMGDTNYATSGTVGVDSPTAAVASLCPDPSNSTATSVAVRCGYTNQGTGGFLAIDPKVVSVQVTR